MQNTATGDYECSSAENPATALVECALDHWTARCMRADNTSAIIIMFELPDNDQREIKAKEAKKSVNKFSTKFRHCRGAVVYQKGLLLRRRGFAARRAGWPMFCPRRSKEMLDAVCRWYRYERVPPARKDSELC
jgi:hypothetical protein